MSATPLQKISAIARVRRHERVFGKDSLLWIGLKKSQEQLWAAGAKVAKFSGITLIGQTIAHGKQLLDNRVVAPTAGTLYKRIGILSIICLSVTTVFGSTFDVSYAQYSDLALTQATQEGMLVADQDGYITKVNPQTTHVERTFKDVALYSVESGDTLSGIAQQFKIKSETLMWENGMTAASMLKVGQKLNIPPANGVSHRVEKGQSVEKIAAMYSVPADKILAMNSLEGKVVAADQIVFVPDGKPLPSAKPARAIANTGGRSAARDSASRNVRTEPVTLKNTDATPSTGKFLIFPTVGSITQGFRKGHYAFDIGNRSKPPIWAAAAGTVEKASSGTYGGGYGNHVIINHGNCVKTLYAHMDSLNVGAGDTVTQGQVVGRMGNTGRVRGITGIHLHFEVIDKGVKKSPSKFY